ncbi:MAG: membrane protein insertion efficiency factor YidD [Deltaproteobacteria bacterium]|nr:membrane protein insertion efficiency factor YidD [Deltaproteobacteria bacterium]
MKALLLLLLQAYKRYVSPVLPPACRFLPTCSVYAMEAVQVHGAARGSWLALMRLGRCHPFSAGGLDPVPLLKASEASMTSDDEGAR